MSQSNKVDSSNSFNKFLLDLSTSLIESLKDNPDALDALLGNKLFMSSKVASDDKGFSKEENTILKLTRELLQDLSMLDDYLEMQMKDEEEYSEEKEEAIADYIDEIMPLIVACTAIDENQKDADFEVEYEDVHRKIMRRIMPLETAEAALFSWEDAISWPYLQSALIKIRFSFIEQKVS